MHIKLSYRVVSAISVNEFRVDLDQSTDVSTASSNLTQHVQRYIDDGSLVRTQGQELIFSLPLASADKFAGNLMWILISLFMASSLCHVLK